MNRGYLVQLAHLLETNEAGAMLEAKKHQQPDETPDQTTLRLIAELRDGRKRISDFKAGND